MLPIQKRTVGRSPASGCVYRGTALEDGIGLWIFLCVKLCATTQIDDFSVPLFLSIWHSLLCLYTVAMHHSLVSERKETTTSVRKLQPVLCRQIELWPVLLLSQSIDLASERVRGYQPYLIASQNFVRFLNSISLSLVLFISPRYYYRYCYSMLMMMNDGEVIWENRTKISTI